MSSRLFTEVHEKHDLTYYVFALNQDYTDTDTLFTQTDVDINRIDETVKIIVTELKKITDETVPTDELEKTHSFTKDHFVLQLETPQNLLLFDLHHEVLEGNFADPNEV